VFILDLSELLGLLAAHLWHVLELAVAAKEELFSEASFGAALWDSEGRIGVLSNDLVSVVDVDSDPLGVGAIGSDSDVLVPAVNREVIVDEPVLLLSNAEMVEVGLPVLALLGGSHIFSVLGGLDSQESTARSVVFSESLVAAFGCREAVYHAAAGDCVYIVVPVDFVAGGGLVVVLVAVSSDVLVVVLVEESDAGADT